MKIWCLAAAAGGLLIAVAGGWISRDATADDKNAAADGEFGTITGQFLLEGEIPKLKPLVENGNMNINDPAICAAADIPDDSLVVDPATKGIANVFVYLPKAETVHPRLKESAKKEVDFDQLGCRFIPHALVVRTDQVVRVKSNDNCAHNTKTNPLKNQPVNFALTANDRTGVEVKNGFAERLPIEVQCNVHNWMSARWLILDHPYGALSGKDGKFTIPDLPAGEHEFVIWQERVGYVERKYKVKVVAGKTTDLGTIKVPAEKFIDKNEKFIDKK
jgi:hypothetical protein